MFVARTIVATTTSTSASTTPATSEEITETWLRIDPKALGAEGGPKEIEEDIIKELVERHGKWMAS